MYNNITFTGNIGGLMRLKTLVRGSPSTKMTNPMTNARTCMLHCIKTKHCDAAMVALIKQYPDDKRLVTCNLYQMNQNHVNFGTFTCDSSETEISQPWSSLWTPGSVAPLMSQIMILNDSLRQVRDIFVTKTFSQDAQKRNVCS